MLSVRASSQGPLYRSENTRLPCVCIAWYAGAVSRRSRRSLAFFPSLSQLPARVRVRDGVLEVSLVASIPCVSVLQLFRLDGGEVAPVTLRRLSTNGFSRPNSAGAGGPSHSREVRSTTCPTYTGGCPASTTRRTALSCRPSALQGLCCSSDFPTTILHLPHLCCVPLPFPHLAQAEDSRSLNPTPPPPRAARSVSMPMPHPPLARRSHAVRPAATDAGPSAHSQPSGGGGGFSASFEARLGPFGGVPLPPRDDGRASRTGSEDQHADGTAAVSVQVRRDSRLHFPTPMRRARPTLPAELSTISASPSRQLLWSADPGEPGAPGNSDGGAIRPPHKLVLETDAAGAMFIEEQARTGTA